MTSGEGIAQSVIFTSFSEVVPVYHAVAAVKGPEHPVAKALLEEVQQLDWDDQGHRVDQKASSEFEGDDLVVIAQSLEAFAEAETATVYQAAARHILTVMTTGEVPPKAVDTGGTRPAAVVTKLRRQQAPRQIHGEIIDGHVELTGFGELLAAMRAVEAFGDDTDTPAAIMLKNDFENADPFKPESLTYWNKTAHSIYRCLGEAAARATETHDLVAADMLRHGDTTPPPIANRLIIERVAA